MTSPGSAFIHAIICDTHAPPCAPTMQHLGYHACMLCHATPVQHTSKSILTLKTKHADQLEITPKNLFLLFLMRADPCPT